MVSNEYIVVEAFSLSGLIEEVNERLKHSWICHGGIAISSRPGLSGNVYLQAMVALPLADEKEGDR